MKKLLLLLAGALAMGGVQAQYLRPVSGFALTAETQAEYNIRPLDNDAKFAALNYELRPSYAFNRNFSLFIPVTATAGFFKMQGANTYDFAGQIGLGLGYTPLHRHNGQLDINVKSGSTVGGSWHYVYYDCGVRYLFNPEQHSISLGLGVRYYDHFKGGLENYCSLYFAVGYRINWYKHR